MRKLQLLFGACMITVFGFPFIAEIISHFVNQKDYHQALTPRQGHVFAGTIKRTDSNISSSFGKWWGKGKEPGVPRNREHTDGKETTWDIDKSSQPPVLQESGQAEDGLWQHSTAIESSLRQERGSIYSESVTAAMIETFKAVRHLHCMRT